MHQRLPNRNATVSSSSSSQLHLTRGCVQGLPCFDSANGADATTTVVNVQAGLSAFWLTSLAVIIFVLGIACGRCGCSCGACRRRQQQRQHADAYVENEVDLEEPLLSSTTVEHNEGENVSHVSDDPLPTNANGTDDDDDDDNNSSNHERASKDEATREEGKGVSFNETGQVAL